MTEPLHLKKLRQSLNTCRGAVNDHDYICKCRPADVRYALNWIVQLEEAVLHMAKTHDDQPPWNCTATMRKVREHLGG